VDGDPFELRPFRDGDERAIVALFERVFGRTMGLSESRDHWQWESVEGPWGPASIQLATLRGRAVAHFGATPRRLDTPAGPRMAGHAIDLMTAPEARGRGAFGALEARTRADLAGRGVDYVFAFLNMNSAPICFGRLGWARSSELHLYAKAAVPWIHSRGGARERDLPSPASAPGARTSRIEPLRSLPEAGALEALRLAARPPAPCIDRSPEYLRWRYEHRPETRYTIVASTGASLDGLAVGLCDRRLGPAHGVILECLAAGQDRARLARLLAGIEGELRRQGAHVMTCLVGGAGTLPEALRHRGFVRLPWSIVPHRIAFGVRRTDGAPLEPEMEPSRWYLTWGDTDLF